MRRYVVIIALLIYGNAAASKNIYSLSKFYIEGMIAAIRIYDHPKDQDERMLSFALRKSQPGWRANTQDLVNEYYFKCTSQDSLAEIIGEYAWIEKQEGRAIDSLNAVHDSSSCVATYQRYELVKTGMKEKALKKFNYHFPDWNSIAK